MTLAHSQPRGLAGDRVLIVGAGYMGSQIALHAAQRGCSVAIVDPDPAALKRLAERDGELRSDRSLRADSPIPLTLATAIEPVAGGIDVAIEAASEKLEIKRQIFAELDRLVSPTALLATNSSSIRISAIEDVATAPERLLNMHFFPPVAQRPLVELMSGTHTSAVTIARAREFAGRIGVTPLMVQRPSTGFLFNRVWRAIKRECLHAVDQGIGSAQDIDRAWMIIYGVQEGPFGSMDSIGLDVVLEIERVYHLESGLDSDRPPQFLMDMVKEGRLGVKTGEGFYRYPDPEFRQPNFVTRAEKETALGSDMERAVVGTWRLVSFDHRDAEGTLIRQLYGEAPAGYVSYTPEGHFHLNVMRQERERFRGFFPESGDRDERAAAFASSMSYAGTWSLGGAEAPAMIHHVQVASFPNWVGADLPRALEVSHGSLVLTATAGLPAGEQVVVTWERVQGGPS